VHDLPVPQRRMTARLPTAVPTAHASTATRREKRTPRGPLEIEGRRVSGIRLAVRRSRFES
jgi:hypothetical protein